MYCTHDFFVNDFNLVVSIWKMDTMPAHYALNFMCVVD